jgi:two-component system, sensor histidine kinase
MARVRSSKKKPAKKAAVRRRTRRREPATLAFEASLVAYAHDIRTTLTGILALGELLASSSLDERERRWAASVKAGAEHLASLTTLMIDAAKADAGSLTLQQETFSPRALIDALADSLAARAEAKGLRAEVTIADGLPDRLVGDAVRLRAALENLVDNAVKFTERGVVHVGVHTVRAARGRVKLTVSVADSGVGLKPAEIKRLFRSFTQANPDIARRYGGAGLGLAVVRRLARLMGGDVTVKSAPGRGATFRFSAVFAVAASDPVEHSSPPPRLAPPAQGLAILCVEDNPYGRVILNTILGELGHRVDFAASGEEAVEAVARGYDAVLMDVSLSGIDGLEATRRIRALPGAAGQTPVIGISGRTDPGDLEAAMAAGMDFYLRKPLSPGALGEALATAVPGNPE